MSRLTMSRLTLLVVLLIPLVLSACASDPLALEPVHPVAARESARRCLEHDDYGGALNASTREIEFAERHHDRRDVLDAYLVRGEALVGLQRHSEARGYLATVKQEGDERQRADATALIALSHSSEGNNELARSYYREIVPTRVSPDRWRRLKLRYSPVVVRKKAEPGAGGRTPLPPYRPVKIYPRSRWAHAPLRASKAVRMEPVYRITVHHTAMMAEPMSASAAAAQMRRIQRAHFERGWADIGYHYVIDPNGRIWEARSLRYQGAHAGNHQLNRGNIGVSLMGNFSRQPVWPRQKQSLGDLLGMLSRRHRVKDHGICGHCKLKNTECPGHHLRRDLPAIVAGMDRAQAPVGRTHRVVRGETLSKIARRYGVTVGSLRAVNPNRGDHIEPGDQIAVP